MTTARLLLTLLLALASLALAATLAPGANAAERVLLVVPYRSQLDGSRTARSNCGPASLAMVLEGYGVAVPTLRLRDLINERQGTRDDPEAGTSIQLMATLADLQGITPYGLRAGGGLHRWNLNEVRASLAKGHPVIAEVRYPALPGRTNESYRGDHYVVIVGFEGESFFFNDPIPDAAGGSRRVITAGQLHHAWERSDLPMAGIAYAGPDGQAGLLPQPAPTFSPTATVAATPWPTATLTTADDWLVAQAMPTEDPDRGLHELGASADSTRGESPIGNATPAETLTVVDQTSPVVSVPATAPTTAAGVAFPLDGWPVLLSCLFAVAAHGLLRTRSA